MWSPLLKVTVWTGMGGLFATLLAARLSKLTQVPHVVTAISSDDRMIDAHEEWEVILITAWLIAPCSAMKSEATGLLIPA